MLTLRDFFRFVGEAIYLGLKYRAFEWLHRLGTELSVERRETLNLWVIRKQNMVTILFAHPAIRRHSILAESLNLYITGDPDPRVPWIEKVDEDHANPRRLWQDVGEPRCPSAIQVARVKATSYSVKQPQRWRYQQQNIDLTFVLLSHAVAAITIEFA
jgi:xylan 1,4-beta-xylosidase